MLDIASEPATKSGKYSKAQYFVNDTPARVAWWLHVALEDDIFLYGIAQDVGRCFDLYSDDMEYELSYNNGSWANGPFPFETFKVHARKNPKRYANADLKSYYVQFRKDFAVAQVCPAEKVQMYGLDCSLMAPANVTTSVEIHPVAARLAQSLHSLMRLFLGM